MQSHAQCTYNIVSCIITGLDIQACYVTAIFQLLSIYVMYSVLNVIQTLMFPSMHTSVYLLMYGIGGWVFMDTTELHDVFYQYVPVGALLTTLRYLLSNSISFLNGNLLQWRIYTRPWLI